MLTDIISTIGEIGNDNAVALASVCFGGPTDLAVDRPLGRAGAFISLWEKRNGIVHADSDALGQEGHATGIWYSVANAILIAVFYLIKKVMKL